MSINYDLLLQGDDCAGAMGLEWVRELLGLEKVHGEPAGPDHLLAPCLRIVLLREDPEDNFVGEVFGLTIVQDVSFQVFSPDQIGGNDGAEHDYERAFEMIIDVMDAALRPAGARGVLLLNGELAVAQKVGEVLELNRAWTRWDSQLLTRRLNQPYHLIDLPQRI